MTSDVFLVFLTYLTTYPNQMGYYIRGRPQRTSAIFRGGGGVKLPTLADARGVGVSGAPTSAFPEYILHRKFKVSRRVYSVKLSIKFGANSIL